VTVTEQLPELFVQRLAEIIPPDRFGGCLESFSLLKPTSFRVNSLRTTEELLMDELESEGFRLLLMDELESEGFRLTRVPWGEGVFSIESVQRRQLTESAAFSEGRIYIQGLSSILAPMALDPRPGETVLDLAAAPGGKTWNAMGPLW